MNRGGKAALLVSSALLGGCTAATNEVKVRPLADPAAAYGNGGNAVALARGQMMIGNVGIALEGFRKAQRDNPSDPAALAGIGDCYAAMGRYDIAQSNYEAALALAPHDPRLLLQLAAIFEREGKIASAMAARAEAAAVSQPAPPVAKVAAAPANAPEVQPAPVVKQQAQAVAPAAPSIARWVVPTPPHVSVQAAPLVSKLEAALAISVPLLAPDVPRPESVKAPAPASGTTEKLVMGVGSVTVALPPARPVEHFEMQAAPLKTAQVQYDYSDLQSSVSVPSPQPAEHFAMRAAPLKVAQVQYDYSRLSSPLTVPLPQPAEHFEMRAAPVKAAHFQHDYSRLPLPVAAPEALPVERLEMRAAPLKVAQVQDDYSRLSSSVTVPLPPARPAEAPAPRPAPKQDIPTLVAEASGPRLERLSRGEVALVTTGKPIWSPQKDVQLASVGNLRWVSLASLKSKPNVQILNAARTNLLAASARTVLLNRGWRKIVVGDASQVKLKSEVQYPKNQATLGRRLAAQFGVAARMVERDVLVLVLGRDAVDRIARPQKS